ncbi:MAG: hypothetical protein J1E99_07990 [Muribaculaceae bacterium]|nr:hypothetical protein [Muribaculaceae bacterium]
MKKHIYVWISASVLLMTSACADKSIEVTGEFPQDDGSEYQTVTFTVGIENQNVVRSREVTYPKDGELSHISDGSKATTLLLDIYMKNGNDWTLVPDYREEIGKPITRENVHFPDTLTFQVRKDQTYRVAFWAQSEAAADSSYFDTSDLTKVEVKYTKTAGGNFANNDELRDAFCTYTEFAGTAKTVSATLTRPFAQINVGTTGYDYEGVAALKPSAVSYAKSSITLDGVAKYYNVLEGKTLAAIDLGDGAQATTSVTFNMATLPAFFNLPEDELNKLDRYVYDPSYEKYILEIKDKENSTGKDTIWGKKHDVMYEEYLKVPFNGNDICSRYMGWDEYVTEKRKLGEKFNPDSAIFDNETLKYMSMCYVLVPEASNLEETAGITGVTYGSVLRSVSFKAKGKEIGDNGSMTDKDVDFDGFTICNVPVQKNWRTNIISKSLFLTNTVFKLYIYPVFAGDYNNTDINGKEPKFGWENDIEMEEGSDKNWKFKGDHNKGNSNTGPGDGQYQKPSDDYQDPK